MTTTYEADIVEWSREQAALLRSGKLAAIDIEHIADEVEDVGKSEKRELRSHMANLLAHLLKWHFQPERRGTSWRVSIRARRREVAQALDESPSLKPSLIDPVWLEIVWGKALDHANNETGIKDFPDACPWSMAQVLDAEFYPD